MIHWQICKLGSDHDIDRMAYAAQAAGCESRIVSLREIAEMYDTVDPEEKCVITMGSIWSNKALRECRPNWFGNFHDKNTFLCSAYYPFWGKYLTQKNYIMLPLGEVARRRDWLYDILGSEETVFIRPDSGEKEFNGELIYRDRFQSWAEDTINRPNVPTTTLCVISQPVAIQKEFRLVMAGGKVVDGSTYRIAKHLASEPLNADPEEMKRIVDFAEMVLTDNPPPLPPIFVLDIAAENDRLSILEVGCFCCCGLYECDRTKVAQGVTAAVAKAYHKENQ